MSDKYRFTEDMDEISGFGGGYEECCRRMVIAGVEWFDANPDAVVEFGILGKEDSEDAKAFTEAVVKAGEGTGLSGNQVGVSRRNAIWIRRNGWDAYVAAKTHPRGEVGILTGKLKDKTEGYDKLLKRYEEMDAELNKRAAIIAEHVLGWKKYKLHSGQEAYAPSQEATEWIGLGCKLTELVDDEIAKMEVES